jgi:hypothetical protein
MRKSVIWPLLGGFAGGGVGFAIAYNAASDSIYKAGDYHNGALRFVGLIAALGFVIGFFLVARLTRGPRYKRDGFTLGYKRPTETGYRDFVTVSVGDLLAGLREVGYDPRAEACDEVGERTKQPIEPTRAVAGANVAFLDSGVRGWVRLQLPIPVEGQNRAMGVLEIWSTGGESTEEFGLFLLRVLDGLVGGMSASRESSKLSDDPVSMITVGLRAKPRFRKA